MNIEEARNEIDVIDNEILSLFAKRMKLGGIIGKIKQEKNMPIENTCREREILLKISKLAGEELQSCSKILFSTLFELSKSYQRRCNAKNGIFSAMISDSLANTPELFPSSAKVSCCGIPGAYAQLAADRFFKLADITYFNDFKSVFNAVEKGLCQYGVLPIENSTAGTIDQVYDLMLDHKFHIVRSCKLSVRHSLLAVPGTKLEDIKEVISHEQGLKQCSGFLDRNSIAVRSAASSTANAAKKVSIEGRKDIAAIASPECAGIYGLEALADNIQDRDSNYTRFICISRNPEIYPGASKISIMGILPHKPGALYSLLARFAVLGVNLTKLESRPKRNGEFEYMFYFDFEASLADMDIRSLLAELVSKENKFTFLGNYSEI